MHDGDGLRVLVDKQEAAVVAGGGLSGGAAARKEVEHEIAGVGVDADDALQDAEGFLGGITVFSLPVGLTMVCHQTSVGVLPRSALAAPTSEGAM